MIHITQEGCIFKIGLNIGWQGAFVPRIKYLVPKKPILWPWIRFVWVWFDFETYTAVSYYFRIRTGLWPFFIFKKTRWDVIDNWAITHRCYIYTREVAEDLCTHLGKYDDRSTYIPLYPKIVREDPYSDLQAPQTPSK